MLLTLTQLQNFKSITSNVNTVKSLDPYIQEAERFDVRPFLGDDLYLKLVDDYEASPSLSTYSDLYNGSTYDWGGRNYKHEGILSMMAYYTYARYVANANIHSTKTGMMVKKNDFSEQISEKTMGRLIDQARSAALACQSDVETFIRRNASDYPTWLGNKKRTSGIRITGVGGNSSGYNKPYKPNSKEDICDNEY